MARGLTYSPEEDAIILSTPVTAEIQARLREAGYERTDGAVKQRRNDLRNGHGGKRSRRVRRRSEGKTSSLLHAAEELEATNERITALEQALLEAKADAEDFRKALAIELAKE